MRDVWLCLSKHVSICKSDIIACACVCRSLFFGLFILFAHFAGQRSKNFLCIFHTHNSLQAQMHNNNNNNKSNNKGGINSHNNPNEMLS